MVNDFLIGGLSAFIVCVIIVLLNGGAIGD